MHVGASGYANGPGPVQGRRIQAVVLAEVLHPRLARRRLWCMMDGPKSY